MEINDSGILIIAAPRTGSTNLMKSISSYYKIKYRLEPRIGEITKSNNKVVKFVPTYGELDSYDSIITSTQSFKNIILLDRKNIKERAESMYVMMVYNNDIRDVKWGNEYIDYNSQLYSSCLDYILKYQKVIKRISNEIDVKIDYYEDVYKNKTLKNKDINLDLKYLEPTFKLRQEIKSKRLV